MTNEELLKKLYRLQEFDIRNKDAKKFIDEWVDDTQLDISKESVAGVGHGSNSKTYARWIKANRKKFPHLAGIIPVDKKSNLIGCPYYAVCAPTDMRLPKRLWDESLEWGKNVLRIIDDTQIEATLKVYLPTRAELDAEVKIYKAQHGKKGRALHKFEVQKNESLPSYSIYYDCEYLSDMLTVFPGSFAFVAPSRRSKSNLYFSYGNYRGILLPVAVTEV